MSSDRNLDDTLAESSVTIQLSLIQKRCNELLENWDGLELTLEEPLQKDDNSDPYNKA